mmetsp:Transcript_59808/g.135321  ORF Transcript_59808/g.135321 Transcript_59808/m.135321 type:complete len:209 (+) Transcript_59808:2789-3415(+)
MMQLRMMHTRIKFSKLGRPTMGLSTVCLKGPSGSILHRPYPMGPSSSASALSATTWFWVSSKQCLSTCDGCSLSVVHASIIKYSSLALLTASWRAVRTTLSSSILSRFSLSLASFFSFSIRSRSSSSLLFFFFFAPASPPSSSSSSSGSDRGASKALSWASRPSCEPTPEASAGAATHLCSGVKLCTSLQRLFQGLRPALERCSGNSG